MFTAESNQKVEKENLPEKTVVPEQQERTVQDSKQQNSELDTEKGQWYTVHEREQTYKIMLRKGCQQRTTQKFRQELWHNGWTTKPTRSNCKEQWTQL